MGNRYEAGVTKAAVSSAAAAATLVTASGSRAVIREIGVSLVTATACEIGIGRPAAAGVGAPTGVLGQALDSADVAALTTLATTFATTQPTAPTNFLRRFELPAVIGAGLVWVWEPQEFVMPISANLVVWCITGTSVTLDTYIKWAE